MSSFPFQFQSKKFRAVSAVKWPKRPTVFRLSYCIFPQRVNSSSTWSLRVIATTAAAAATHNSRLLLLARTSADSNHEKRQDNDHPGWKSNGGRRERPQTNRTAAAHKFCITQLHVPSFPFLGSRRYCATIVRRSGIIDCKNASYKVEENHMEMSHIWPRTCYSRLVFVGIENLLQKSSILEHQNRTNPFKKLSPRNQHFASLASSIETLLMISKPLWW